MSEVAKLSLLLYTYREGKKTSCNKIIVLRVAINFYTKKLYDISISNIRKKYPTKISCITFLRVHREGKKAKKRALCSKGSASKRPRRNKKKRGVVAKT